MVTLFLKTPNSPSFRFSRREIPLWRASVVGADRTLDEFQTGLTHAVGLNQDHRWRFGTGHDYWDSAIQSKRPGAIEQSPSGLMRSGKDYDAGETTIGQMARHLDRDERDRLCSLFDDGDEWRFDAIRTDIDEGGPSDTAPAVVTEKGEPVEQYGLLDEEW
jgi:hypothetical protein